MPVVALPRLIEEKFEDLAGQVRRLWLYRGVSRVVVTAILVALVGMALDRWIGFSPLARWIVTLSWLAIVALSIHRFVLRPLRMPLNSTTLAAAIETQFPSLSERLMTLVELSEQSEPGHGSKPLIDLLVRDTATRTKRLNFTKAAPSASAIRMGLAAGLLAGLALAGLLSVTGGFNSMKRFLAPWHTPAAAEPFLIRVPSGSVMVKRGEAVTLTAYLERRIPDAVLPVTATLVARDKSNAEKKFPMTGDTHAAFQMTRPAVTSDFEYRIEAGPVASEWYAVTVTDPVTLADGTMIRVTPPEYATPPLAAVSLPGLPPVDALQYSQLQFTLKFQRPATGVVFDWAAIEKPDDAMQLPITLAEDKLSATANVTLKASGTYRVTISGDHGVQTILSMPAKANIDRPPTFEKAIGIGGQPKSVKPTETLIVETAATDDFRIASLVLEYAINGGKPVEIKLTVREPNAVRAEAKHVLPLAGLVKEGDTFAYRLRATDNRHVEGRGPQTTTYPEKDWAKLTISASAESLEQQDILSKRDAIKSKLEAAAAATNDARQNAERVRRSGADKPMLTPEQTGRLQSAREASDNAAKALDDAAKEAALAPELNDLANALRATANDALRGADDLLRRAEHEPNAAVRPDHIATAEKKLADARDRIEKLLALNETISRNRLDKRRLEKLADEVRQLAEEANAATDPAKREELLKKLQRAKDELRDVVNGNDALRRGTENAANRTAKDLADEAERLKAAQKTLDEAVNAAEAKARTAALTDAAKRQAELNARADQLRDRAADAARRTGEAPLAKAPFDDAHDKLKSGDSVAAMTEQEKAARDLDRFADALEKAARERIDPKQAAKQLADLQDDLRKRVQDAAKKPLTENQKTKFMEQQEAIRKAAERITAAPDDVSGQAERASALAKLKDANDALANDPAAAAEPMADAADALKRLADKLPTREARMKQSKLALEKLIREQDALRGDVERKLKAFDKRKPDDAVQMEIATKLQDAAKKQTELAERLAALDAPGLEGRRERTAGAATRAADDLRDGRPLDIPASQDDLRRRMSQLRTAMDGGVPGDAVADALARRQNALADRLANKKPDAKTLGELNKLQREIADQTGGFHDPDGADRLSRAKQSTESASKQFQQADDWDELRKKAKQAANDLDELADHLSGVEGDRERIERLAKQRRERAEWSKANAAKPTPPEQAVEMQGELERELADLKQIRSGSAQEEKKSAIDQLEKLRRTPNAERAPAVQQAAAEALDELAKKMKREDLQPSRGERLPSSRDASGDAGGQLPSQAEADAARKLATEQRAIRDAAARTAGQSKPDADTTAGQVKQQEKLADDAGQLARKLDGASHSPANGEADAASLTKAAEAAKKAQEQMARAAREQAAGRGAGASEARDGAVKSLDAAKSAAQEAAGNTGVNADPNAAAASKAVEAANGHLRDAGQAAAKNEAGKPLEKAAEKIGEAADKLGEAGPQGSKPGSPVPGANTGAGGKPLTEAELPPDLKQYAGKPWGELPGDVQSRIIQDLKAKYGEDYARVIKLYFETLAEKK